MTRILNRRTLFLAAASLFGAALPATQATAQAAWPSQTVRVIVPFAPGGASDSVARTIAQKLSEKWKHPVVIENKPGANTAIGAAETMRSAPDGHTLFQAINSTLTVNPFTFNKLGYDPIKDFTPISLVATIPIVFVVNENLGIKNIADLVKEAKAKPGSLSVGHGTVGLQLAAVRFAKDSGIGMTYVPYKSGVDVTKGLLTGEINIGVDAVAANLPHIKTGKMRALATNHSSRLPALPDTPTLAELGYKNSEAGMWLAFMAPAGLPTPLRNRIAEDIRQILAQDDVKEKFRGLGVEPTWEAGEQVTTRIQTETAKFGPLVKELGVKME